MRIVSVAQMRALEAAAFAGGITETALQEQAGAAVAAEVERLLRQGGGSGVVVLAGRGNNGRDGAVAARLLAAGGRGVRLMLAPGHAVTAAEADTLRGYGATAAETADPAAVVDAAERADVLVDGLVGIGARGALREPLAGWARAVNAVRARREGLAVLAVDIPSGIEADSGQVPGAAVLADVTVTLGAVKAGLLRFPAAHCVGRLVFGRLALPADAEAALPAAVLGAGEGPLHLRPRPLDAHKYQRGRLLVVAGSDEMPGAATLCVRAAARAGAGLVTLAAPRAVRDLVLARTPEATSVLLDDAPGDPARALEQLTPRLRQADALLVGPGLGRAEGTLRMVRQLLEARVALGAAPRGVVVDADGLFALAGWPEWWRHVGANVVLTPHAGELARLRGRGADEEEAEAPWEAAARDARRWGCVLVAKAPFTAVASPDGHVEVWPRANPLLASGGTGDVLAGLCAALLLQAGSPWGAARLAVCAHARAGEAIRERGWRTLLASDLTDEIPTQLSRLAPTEWHERQACAAETEDGGRRTEDGGRRTEDGGRRTED